MASIGNTNQNKVFGRHPCARTLMTLFDFLPGVAFYAKDRESRFIKVNEPFVAAHGVESEAEMLGRDDRDFHPPAMAEAYIAEDRRVMEQGKAICGCLWLVFHARRVPHWYVSTKVPLLDPAGEVVGLAGAMYGVERPEERDCFFRELSPIIEHIESHFAEPIVMAEMAELAGLSSTHFNRRFQQLLRMTPTYYLRMIRVQAGRRLLSTTRKTLAEIAAMTGFTDQSHFTRCFRQSTGLTPGGYRRRFSEDCMTHSAAQRNFGECSG